MRTSTVATVGLALLTAGAAMLTLNNYQKAGAQAAADAAAAREPRYTLTGARWMRLDDGGNPEYVAQAEQLEYFDDQSSRMTQPVVSDFGGKTSPWTLSAPQGSTKAHSRDVLLQQQVLIVGHWQDGRETRITTPRLWVDTQKKLLHTDAEVQMDSFGRKMKAKGLIADSAGESVKLLGDVQGVYEPNS